MPMSLVQCDNYWLGQVERRKLVTSMLALTVFGGLLLVPPLVYVFNQPINHSGIPQIVLYLFAVWLLMIVGTAALTRLLPPDSDPANGPEGD